MYKTSFLLCFHTFQKVVFYFYFFFYFIFFFLFFVFFFIIIIFFLLDTLQRKSKFAHFKTISSLLPMHIKFYLKKNQIFSRFPIVNMSANYA